VEKEQKMTVAALNDVQVSNLNIFYNVMNFKDVTNFNNMKDFINWTDFNVTGFNNLMNFKA
jgi:hypothetical protein